MSNQKTNGALVVAPTPTDLDALPTREKIALIRSALSAAFVARDELIEAMLVALVAKHHVVTISPPGAAKSAVARAVADSIYGGSYFERLLSRFSTEEDLFGPRSLSAMKVDRWERVTADTLIDSRVAFLDEIFKANGSILNALLTILNERVYHNGNAGTLTSGLWTVLAASNELPEDSSLAALYDRFLVRLRLDYIAQDADFDRMLDDTAGAYSPPVRISLAELETANREAMQINAPAIPDAVKAALRALKASLAGQGVIVSDRRWKQSLSLLRAAAWLDGSPSIELDHFEVLRWSLWSTEENIPIVTAALSAIDTGVVGDVVRITDNALRKWEARPRSVAEYHPQMEGLGSMLETALRQVEARCSQGITKRAASKVDVKIKPLYAALDTLRADIAARWKLSRGAGT